MSDEIVAVESTEIEVASPEYALPAIPNRFDDLFDANTSGSFLPRIQLEGSNSKKVKQNKIPKGNYSLITGRDSFQDLGKSVDVLILDYRSKAMDITDKKNVVVVYDMDDPAFKRIRATKGQGYLWGLEFLVYIPSADGDVKFATLFMGNPTNRVAARYFKPYSHAKTLAERAVTLDHEILENADYTWEGPTVKKCSTGLSSYPDPKELHDQRTMFLDPPKGVQNEKDAEEEVAAVPGDERAR
jgi:hypothetical protein